MAEHTGSERQDTILHVIHSGVPDAKAESTGRGWQNHYWKS